MPEYSAEQFGAAVDAILRAYANGQIPTRAEAVSQLHSLVVGIGYSEGQATQLAEGYITNRMPQLGLTEPGTTGGAGTTTGPLAKPSFTPYSPMSNVNIKTLGEQNAFAAYMRENALPGAGLTDYQQWQAQQFQPSYGTYQASTYLNPKQTPATWGEYMPKQGNVFEQRDVAAKLFQQARTGNQQEFLEGGTDLENLLQGALRSQYGAPVAQAMSGWIPGLRAEYQAETGGAGTDLLGWLSKRLRLG